MTITAGICSRTGEGQKKTTGSDTIDAVDQYLFKRFSQSQMQQNECQKINSEVDIDCPTTGGRDG
jgi:hypothetical protein